MEKDRIKILFERYLTNELSKEELVEFIKVMEQYSPEKDNSLDEIIQENWETTKKFENKTTQIGERRISNIVNNIEKDELHQKKIKGFQVKNLIPTVAAASLLLICGIYYWYNHSNSQQFTTQSGKEDLLSINVPFGKKKKIALPDSSIVVLNGGSTLTYTTEFNRTARKVSLNGEAFFNVKKNSTKPFIISNNNNYIRVLGTSFNVKSYKEDNKLEVAVASGTVEVGKKANRTTKDLSFGKLTAKDYLKYNIVTDEIEIIRNKNSEQFISWKDQKLVFESQKFESIAKDLERWYGYKIIFKNPHLEKIVFSGEFDNLDIKSLLEILKASYPFEYLIENKTIYIN